MCRKIKAARDTYNRLLQPLPVPERPWVDMTMDFVTGLLKCHAYGQIYDAILMVIDCLLKKRHYIPCLKKNEGTSAEATAELFMQHVWSREDLLISITSDKRPQFVIKMWNSFCKLLGIKAKLFTTWHPETNNQSKIANQEMKQYLRSYVNHFQDDWVRLLPMAEFVGNANTFASIKIPLFLASQGLVLCMNFDPVNLSAFLTREQLANSQAKSLANCMQAVWNFTCKEIIKSQAAQVKAANKHQKEAPKY